MSMDARSGTFWLGVGLSLAGSFCSALGLAFQRLSHKRNNALPPEERVRSVRQWLNLLGIFLLFIESLFDLASFGFAPASILSCMGAFTLVFNMILAPALCGEEVSKRDVLVNCIVMVGTLVAVWFGPHETPDYDVPKLLDLFVSTRFAIYATLLILWIVLLLVCWWGLKGDMRSQPPRGGLKVFQTWTPIRRSRVLRFTYPALAGSIGGNTAVYAKASIELVKTTVKGNNQLVYAGFYLMIGLMLMCLFGQLNFLNSGLKHYDALYVVPVYQVFWITSGILGAMFYFDEVAHLTGLELGMFICGALVSMGGISLHATRSNINDLVVTTEEEEEGDDLMSNDVLVEEEDEENGTSMTKNKKDSSNLDYEAGINTNNNDDEEEEIFMKDEDDILLEIHPSHSSGGARTRSFTEEYPPKRMDHTNNDHDEPAVRTRAVSHDIISTPTTGTTPTTRDRTFT